MCLVTYRNGLPGLRAIQKSRGHARRIWTGTPLKVDDHRELPIRNKYRTIKAFRKRHGDCGDAFLLLGSLADSTTYFLRLDQKRSLGL